MCAANTMSMQKFCRASCLGLLVLVFASSSLGRLALVFSSWAACLDLCVFESWSACLGLLVLDCLSWSSRLRVLVGLPWSSRLKRAPPLRRSLSSELSASDCLLSDICCLLLPVACRVLSVICSHCRAKPTLPDVPNRGWTESGIQLGSLRSETTCNDLGNRIRLSQAPQSAGQQFRSQKIW